MNNLGQLSTELVSLIVNFVDQRDLHACALINRSFHAITTPILWRTLHDKNIGVFTKLIKDTPSCHDGVEQHIRHANFNDLDNATFIFMMEHLPYLETLAIDSARFITDDSLQQLPMHCPHLASLHLRQTPITRRSLMKIAKHCQHIWRLDLDKCNNLGFDVYSALPAMRSLKQLYIQGGYNDLLAINNKEMKAAARYVAGLNGLTHLTLTGIPSHFAYRLLGNASTTTTWPHLIQLCVGSGYDLTEPQVIDFIQHHPSLVSLELHMTDLSDATLEAISVYLPNIKQLGLVRWLRITPAGIRQLVCHCRSLLHVYFGDWSHDLSYAFPEASGYCFIDLRQRRKLFQLDLGTINAIRFGDPLNAQH